MIHRKGISAMLCLAWLLAAAAATAAPSPDVLSSVTTGAHTIKGQNIPGAKAKAVNQALGLAVQNAFASLVSREVFASNLEFLYGQLLPEAANYVITYRVMDGLVYKGTYLVGVESKIDLDRLEKRLVDARILRAGKDKPVLLFLIAEQAPGELLPRYWWGKNPEPYTSLAESILKERMARDRFTFAHSGSQYPEPSFYNIQFDAIYDAQAAMALGKAMKADMVVMGKAWASESANRMGDEKTFDARLELKAFDLASDRTVVNFSSKATAKSETESQGAEKALTLAAEKAAFELATRINAHWSQAMRKESRFALSIEGENFLTRFIALKKRIQDLRDVQNMQPKEIGSGQAILEIVFKGSTQQFADAVLLKTFEGFGLEIAEVTPESVVIKFVESRDSGPIAADADASGQSGEKIDQ